MDSNLCKAELSIENDVALEMRGAGFGGHFVAECDVLGFSGDKGFVGLDMVVSIIVGGEDPVFCSTHDARVRIVSEYIITSLTSIPIQFFFGILTYSVKMSLVPFQAGVGTLAHILRTPTAKRFAANAARSAAKHVLTNMPRYMTRFQRARLAAIAKNAAYHARIRNKARYTTTSTQRRKSSYVRHRKSIGYKRNQGATKRTETTYPQQDEDTRTLDVLHMTQIPKTETNDIDSRQRNQVFITGMKFCMELLNNTDACLLVNIALVVPKAQRTLIPTNATSILFRGTGETRGLDFSTALASTDLHCRPINTDKYYVLMHKRLKIAPAISTAVTQTSQKANYRFLNFYKKVNRSFRWNSDDNEMPITHPIYMLMWCDKAFSAENTTPTTGALTVSRRHIIYFREPNN